MMWVDVKEQEFSRQLGLALTAHSDIKGYACMQTPVNLVLIWASENLAQGVTLGRLATGRQTTVCTVWNCFHKREITE